MNFLGAPQVSYEGTILKFRSRKVLALLIYLVVEGGYHHREKLVDIFWSTSGQSQGNATLRSTLARLKKTLAVAGDYLITESGTISFDYTQPVELDVNQVIDATESGEITQLEVALTNLHGEFLDGFSLKDAPEFDEWAMLQREIWHQRIERVFEQLSRLQVEQGTIDYAISTATHWVAHSPLTEFAYQRLIETQALSGNRSAALQTYERCKAVLSAELSILPSADLTALIERLQSQPTGKNQYSLSHRTETHTPQSIDLPFIGRAKEYQALISAYHQSKDNLPQIAVLSADAGMGKTRLSQAFLNWVTVGDPTADVLKGQAFEIGGRLPYQPIVEALRIRIEAENAPEDLLADVWLAELSQLLPELRDRYPDLPTPLIGNIDLTRSRIFEAVARLFEALAKKRPVVLFIDDVQWADDGSLDLLHYLMRWWHEHRLPIFTLISVRRENIDIDVKLKEWIGHIRRDSSLLLLTLEHLTPTNLTLLISQLAAKSVPDQFIRQFSDWLYSETQGQPFFMSEMLQMLVQRNLIIYRSDMQEPRIDITASLALIETEDRLPLPPTIRHLILARLEHLSESSSAILLAGAVVGRETSFDILKHVSGLSEELSLSGLEKAIKHRLLIETHTKRLPYSFSHDKIREIAYTQASEARRQIYHRRALGVLVQTGASASELAFHAFAANQMTQAFRYYLVAGDDALRTYALPDALKHFEQAHSIHETIDCNADEILQLYRQWGRTLELAHRFEDALLVYKDLASLGEQFDNQNMTLVSLISQAILFATTTPLKDPKEGEILATKALDLARQLGEHEIETRALWSMLLVHHYGSGEEEKAKEYGELALGIAREFDLEEMIAYVLNDLNWVYCALGNFRQARLCSMEAVTRWRELGNISMLLDSLNGVGILYSLVGAFEQSEAAINEALDLAHATGNIWNQIALEANLLWVFREHGQYDRIIPALRTAIEFAERTMPNIAPYYQASLAFMYADLGMASLTTRLCDRILEGVDSTPVFWRLSDMVHAIYAYLNIQQGDLLSARSSLQQIQLEVDNIGIAHVTVITPLLRCQLAVAEADYALVIDLATEFTQILENSGVRVGLADAYYYRAQGLLAQGKFDLAQHALTQANQVAESLQARRIQWQILLGMSKLMSQSGNEAASMRLLQDAHSTVEYIIKHIPDKTLRNSFTNFADVRSLLL